MGFLKTRFFKDNAVENIDAVSEQNETASENCQQNIPKNSHETIPIDPISVNLMSRFFRSQKLSSSEPPEILHENEAWAPETEFVGLFRKHRVNVEVHPSSSSDPQ